MSRISTSTINAALAKDVVKVTARITAYKSRVYMEAPDVDSSEVLSVSALASEEIAVPEAIAWMDDVDEFVTVFIEEDNRIGLCIKGLAPVYLKMAGEYLMTDGVSRPGIFQNNVFYNDGDVWSVLVIDTDLLLLATEECVTSKTEIVSLTDIQFPGAIYPVSATEFSFLFIDEGAVGIFSGDVTSGSLSPSRIFNPTIVLTDADVNLLHFAGAAKLGEDIFTYFTAHSGEVRGIKYCENGWSDIFVAIPSDISSFRIGNVASVGTSIFICGNFRRNEEFESDACYTLLSKSVDGFVFSLDRKTLVSILGYRFLFSFHDGDIIFSSMNRFHVEQAPYQVIGEDTEKVIVESLSVSGNTAGWNVPLKAGNEAYVNHPLMQTGFFSKLEIGIYTTAGIEWIKYHDTVIESISRGFRDGDRAFSIKLVPDARWHTSAMTHPLYMEIQGKSGNYDKTLELSELYKLIPESSTEWPLTIDLWSSHKPGVAFGPNSHVELTTTDHMSGDLLTFCTEYPVFGDDDDYVCNIYGWSRAGKPDTNPNTEDPTDVEGPNDDIYMVIEVEDSNGNVTTVVSDIGELSSTHINFPQTYFEEGIRDGSYPVSFTIANPGVGKKIRRVGARLISGAAQTVYYIERIEMPGIKARYIQNESDLSDSARSFSTTKATSNWPLVSKLTLQVDTNNATNGNMVTTGLLKAGYCYAIAIIGKVEFTRLGTKYIQDAEFYCESDSVKPTWTRSYPPGIGPVFDSFVNVTASELPEFGIGDVIYHSVNTKRSPENQTHRYLFKHSDTRMKSSTIGNNAIPYVYSDGDPISVALYLVGSDVISDIVDGEFTVYVFESPVPYIDFDLYGGITDEINGNFEVTQNIRTAYIPDIPYNSYISDAGYVEQMGGAGGFGEGDANDIIIKAFGGTGACKVNVDMQFTFAKGGLGSFFVTDFFNTIFNDGVPVAYESKACPADATSYFLQTKFTTTVHGDDELRIKQGWAYAYPYVSTGHTRIVNITVTPGTPVNPQVPVPPSFILVLGGQGGTIENDAINTRLETRQKGIPQILFATTPYSAWNFEAVSGIMVSGEYSHAGIVGLAEDENNYLVGYYTKDTFGIAKVRDGIRTVIVENTVVGIENDKLYHLRFWHRDGLLGLDIKRAQDTWAKRGAAGTGCTVKWLADYGPIATSDVIYHLGIYAFINPPKFRTVGYTSSNDYVPVLPLDSNVEEGSSDFINRFPDFGKIDIQGVIYSYVTRNKTMYDTSRPYMGPFQLRNTESWSKPFNSDREGFTYQEGAAVEITQFNWWSGTEHAVDFAGNIIASSSGFNWYIEQTLWKVWITTGKKVVWLRNRARHYSLDMPDYYPDGNEKFYITDGLTGVRAVSEEEVEYNHPYGSIVYYDNDDKVSIHGFSAVSGNHDESVQTLLEKFCKVAGTNASFIGDSVTPSRVLISGEEMDL